MAWRLPVPTMPRSWLGRMLLAFALLWLVVGGLAYSCSRPDDCDPGQMLRQAVQPDDGEWRVTVYRRQCELFGDETTTWDVELRRYPRKSVRGTPARMTLIRIWRDGPASDAAEHVLDARWTGQWAIEVTVPNDRWPPPSIDSLWGIGISYRYVPDVPAERECIAAWYLQPGGEQNRTYDERVAALRACRKLRPAS